MEKGRLRAEWRLVSLWCCGKYKRLSLGADQSAPGWGEKAAISQISVAITNRFNNVAGECFLEPFVKTHDIPRLETFCLADNDQIREVTSPLVLRSCFSYDRGFGGGKHRGVNKRFQTKNRLYGYPHDADAFECIYQVYAFLMKRMRDLSSPHKGG